MKTSISFLKSTTSYEETIQKINNTSSDYLHVDVMDGIFVPNKNFTPEEMGEVLKFSTKPMDVHLMVSNPKEYIAVLKKLKPEYITIHIEIDDFEKYFYEIKKFTKVGISIKPETDLEVLKPYLTQADLIMVMGVNPGWGGQEMLPKTLERIEKLIKLRDKNHFLISIDGGVNEETLPKIKKTKVDMIVSGSFVTMSLDFEKQINKLK